MTRRGRDAYSAPPSLFFSIVDAGFCPCRDNMESLNKSDFLHRGLKISRNKGKNPPKSPQIRCPIPGKGVLDPEKGQTTLLSYLAASSCSKSKHIKIGTGEQGIKPVFVLCQSPIWYFLEAKLPLDDAERMLHLAAHSGLLALDIPHPVDCPV